jgi:hypothetical protein
MINTHSFHGVVQLEVSSRYYEIEADDLAKLVAYVPFVTFRMIDRMS